MLHNPINFKLILSLSMLRLALDIIYSIYIVDIFGYSGFYGESSILHYFLSWMIFLPSIFIIDSFFKKEFRISYMVLVIIYLVSFVPFTTMLAFNALTMKYYVFNILYWIFLFIYIINLKNIKIVNIRMSKNAMNSLFIWVIGFISLMLILLISWQYTGFRFTFNLLDVYSIRGDVISRLPAVLQYMYSASNAINPILLIYALINKNYLLSIFIIIIQFLSFGINGSKSVFFMTLLTIAIYYIFKKNVLQIIVKLITTLSVFSILEFSFTSSSFLVDFIVRRVMFVPNLINYYYFDFFTDNTPDYFRQSIFSIIGLKSPYGRIPNLIGEIYMNNKLTAANGGLASDAAQNFGYLGALVSPLILAIFLKVLDDVSKNLDPRITVVVAVYFSNVIISSTLTTALLTHGLFLVLLILYFMPRNDEVELPKYI